LYLPLEDLNHFGVSEAQLLGGAPRTPAVDALLAFEAGRAQEHYTRAAALLPAADRRRLGAAGVMGGLYHGLPAAVARRGYPLAGPRVRLSAWRKLRMALGACARTLLP